MSRLKLNVRHDDYDKPAEWQLERMSTIDLLLRLVTDISHSVDIRRELNYRFVYPDNKQRVWKKLIKDKEDEEAAAEALIKEAEALKAKAEPPAHLSGKEKDLFRQHQEEAKAIKDIRPILRKVLHGQVGRDEGATALLTCGWDSVDPLGRMRKAPEECVSFLRQVEFELGTYEEMYPTRKNLFKMLIDAYLRALEAQERKAA